MYENMRAWRREIQDVGMKRCKDIELPDVLYFKRSSFIPAKF